MCNACVKEIIARVKSLQNFTLFCQESRNFALFGGFFQHILELYDTFGNFFLCCKMWTTNLIYGKTQYAQFKSLPKPSIVCCAPRESLTSFGTSLGQIFQDNPFGFFILFFPENHHVERRQSGQRIRQTNDRCREDWWTKLHFDIGWVDIISLQARRSRKRIIAWRFGLTKDHCR